MLADDVLTGIDAIKVLVIEDDRCLSDELLSLLQVSGMHALAAQTGQAGLLLQRQYEPDVVVTDIILPDTDGVGLVTSLLRQDRCGIIILSGQAGEADRIVGLEIGADDYIVKPPHPRELLARIRAVHRRVRCRAAAVRAGASWVGSCRVDLAAREVRGANGDHVSLTHAEFAALEVLMAARGAAVTRDRLSEAALRRPWRAEDRSVDQLILGLRHKLSSGEDLHAIRTVRGEGYMLVIGDAEPLA